MRQSEVISKLIYLAFIVNAEPVPVTDDGKTLLSWDDAMQAYAEAVAAERTALSSNLHDPVSDSDTGKADGVRVICTQATPEVMDFMRNAIAKGEADERALHDAVGGFSDDLPPQAPPPDLPPLPEPVVLRGSKMQPVGVVTGAKFAGKEAGNKRKIYDRVCAYRAAYGLGAYATIAAASKGKLTEWDVRDIVDGKKVKYDLWLKLKDVLDHLDGVGADAVADNED